MTLLDCSTIALFAILNNPVTARAKIFQLIGSVKEADAVTNAERVDIVGEAALGKFVRLDVIQAHNGVRHDAAMPISAVAFVTSIVVTHSDIVANHMSHCTCHQVRLVRIDIDAQSNRFSRANRVRAAMPEPPANVSPERS